MSKGKEKGKRSKPSSDQVPYSLLCVEQSEDTVDGQHVMRTRYPKKLDRFCLVVDLEQDQDPGPLLQAVREHSKSSTVLPFFQVVGCHSFVHDPGSKTERPVGYYGAMHMPSWTGRALLGAALANYLEGFRIHVSEGVTRIRRAHPGAGGRLSPKEVLRLHAGLLREARETGEQLSQQLQQHNRGIINALRDMANALEENGEQLDNWLQTCETAFTSDVRRTGPQDLLDLYLRLHAAAKSDGYSVTEQGSLVDESPSSNSVSS